MPTGDKGAGKTFREWFWEGVTVPPGADRKECWLWNRKASTLQGYGIFKKRYAHRVAYELEHGPIATGLLVCHTCDNPKCCNPFHLFPGTQTDNMRDAKRKMRIKGAKPKLSVQEVQELRRLAAQGVSYDDLEIRFKLNRCSLHDAVKRKTYQWVT